MHREVSRIRLIRQYVQVTLISDDDLGENIEWSIKGVSMGWGNFLIVANKCIPLEVVLDICGEEDTSLSTFEAYIEMCPIPAFVNGRQGILVKSDCGDLYMPDQPPNTAGCHYAKIKCSDCDCYPCVGCGDSFVYDCDIKKAICCDCLGMNLFEFILMPILIEKENTQGGMKKLDATDNLSTL